MQLLITSFSYVDNHLCFCGVAFLFSRVVIVLFLGHSIGFSLTSTRTVSISQANSRVGLVHLTYRKHNPQFAFDSVQQAS